MSFQIDDFTPEAPVNPYAAAVDALAKAGEGKQLTVTVPTTDREDKPGSAAVRERIKFQRAANDAGYTARARKTVENDDNTTAITFTLGPRETRGPRGKVEDVATDSE